MKLLNKLSLYLLGILIPVLFLGGYVTFIIISNKINESTEEWLINQKDKIISIVQNCNACDSNLSTHFSDEVKIVHVNKLNSNKNIFSDTPFFDSLEMEEVIFRQLKTGFIKNGSAYSLTIIRSDFEREELAESIAVSLFIMFFLVLLSIIIINRLVSKKIFNPFYTTLEKLPLLSFPDNQLFQMSRTSIKEFDALNKALNLMTQRLFADYNNQKQFTENASHELQTPLAIIKSRIDILIQDKTLTEESINQIQEIETSVNKLSHLNKSLLLLSKIENRQFDESVEFDLKTLIDKIINNFSDAILSKDLQLKKYYNDNSIVSMSPVLAEILFSNLLQNAIRHNDAKGTIKIEINKYFFKISNTGQPLIGNENELFQRFTKFNSSYDSIGLGLAIVKQISEYYNFRITYSFADGLHSFTLEMRS